MEIKELPHINQKKDVWKDAIGKLNFDQRLIIKKKLEYLLNIVMATNRSISAKEYKDIMFKADKLRKNYDITKLPADKLNRYQKSQLVNIRQEHPDLEKERKMSHWKPCQKCGEKPYNLHEWRGEMICYSCMKDMGLIGL